MRPHLFRVLVPLTVLGLASLPAIVVATPTVTPSPNLELATWSRLTMSAHGAVAPPTAPPTTAPSSAPSPPTTTVPVPAAPAPTTTSSTTTSVVPSVPSTTYQAPVSTSGGLDSTVYAEWTRVAVCEEGGWIGYAGPAYPDSLGISAAAWAEYNGGSDLSPANQIRVGQAIEAAAGNPGYVPDQGYCASW